MRCPVCGHDNPAGYRFCGSCGRPGVESIAAIRLGTAEVHDSPATALAADVLPRQARTLPSHDQEDAAGQPRVSGPDREVTRYMCAAVNINEDLARAAIEQMLEEQNRAIAITPNTDLVAVLKYALRANRRRLFRDIWLFFILCALVAVAIFSGHIPLAGAVFIALLVGAWLTVFIERYVRYFGPAAAGLRPGKFDPARAPAPARDPFAERQLARIADVSKTGNVTVYSAFQPFVGYGNVHSSWSFTVDVTRGRHGAEPTPFNVLDIYDYVKAHLSELDLPLLEATHRLFVNGQDIYGDPRFLPDPDSRPVTQVDETLLRQLMTVPEERARPYLTVGMAGWQGDLVVTMFVRFLLSRNYLFVEAAHTAVPPLRTEFREIDMLDTAPTGKQFFRLAGGSLKSTIPRLFGSIPGIFHGLLQENRRSRKQHPVGRVFDYGSLFSIRQAVADTNWQRYFQKLDGEQYTKVVEKRLFNSLADFLIDHDVDASELMSRGETIINNGVMISGRARVEGSQIAGGQGRVTAVISRVSGHQGVSSDGGNS
jgi:hypothetical protein